MRYSRLRQRYPLRALVSLLMLLGTQRCWAENVGTELQQALMQRALVLRESPLDDQMVFDVKRIRPEDSKVSSASMSILRVKTVKLDGKQLTIVGDRSFLIYQPASKHWALGESAGDLKIEIRLGQSIPTKELVYKSLEGVFAPSSEEIKEVAPSEWRDALVDNNDDVAAVIGVVMEQARQVAMVARGLDSGVNPPKPLPLPGAKGASHNNETRDGVRGSATVTAFVDEEGNVSLVRPSRSSEPLMAWEALIAVGKWRFEPARFQGKPVAVRVPVNLNFNLH